MNNPLGWLGLFFSSTFFTGFLPGWLHPRLKGKGGGLMGSIVAAVALWLLWDANRQTLLVITFVISGPLGYWAVAKGEALMSAKWGPRRRHTGEEVNDDYNETNIDEVAGMFAGAYMIWHMKMTSPWSLVALFIVFRILDTLKPWPISWFEQRWKKSNPILAVMVDDIVAGMIAGFVVGLLIAFRPGLFY